MTATVAKSSSGAVHYMPVARVTNIAQTLEQLKKRGVWVTGASMDGALYTEIDFSGSVALVIGAEGAGISRLVREHCDFIASIPLRGQIDSLNAGVAAGVLMYEVVRQRH